VGSRWRSGPGKKRWFLGPSPPPEAKTLGCPLIVPDCEMVHLHAADTRDNAQNFTIRDLFQYHGVKAVAPLLDISEMKSCGIRDRLHSFLLGCHGRNGLRRGTGCITGIHVQLQQIRQLSRYLVRAGCLAAGQGAETIEINWGRTFRYQ
jgi:hypothetical protein